MTRVGIQQFVPNCNVIKSISHHGMLVEQTLHIFCGNIFFKNIDSAIIAQCAFRHHFNIDRIYRVPVQDSKQGWQGLGCTPVT
jgi:hypothetical protein